MNRRSSKYYLLSRSGMTLVELLAALALVGTLLVMLTLAQSRIAAQCARAERRQAAVKLADQLLARWWCAAPSVPVPAAGQVSGDPFLSWRTSYVGNKVAHALQIRFVRLEIVEKALDPSAPPLCKVDIVVTEPNEQSR